MRFYGYILRELRAFTYRGWGIQRAENGSFSFEGPTPETLRQFKAVWQGSDAQAVGLRTYPLLGLSSDIVWLRGMFVAENLDAIIADLCAAVQAAGVQGINIDSEPPVDVRNKTNNPTFADGLAFASFLDKLAQALHKQPSRPILTMDSLSVGSACWSAPPLEEPTHVWDELPCPWIRRFWNLQVHKQPHPLLATSRSFRQSSVACDCRDAIADSALDVVIPMDTYDSNDTAFAWNMYQYQKFFVVSQIGWGLYPTDMVGKNNGAHTAEYAKGRVAAISSYSGSWISTWVIDPNQPGYAENITAVGRLWAPWIPPLRSFLAGGEIK